MADQEDGKSAHFRLSFKQNKLIKFSVVSDHIVLKRFQVIKDLISSRAKNNVHFVALILQRCNAHKALEKRPSLR